MNRTIAAGTTGPSRVASWFRRDYPRSAPARGHSYLIALCGADSLATR